MALHLGTGVSRKNVIAALWPDQDPHLAANRLRVALTEFRRDFGVAFVEQSGIIGFDPAFTTVDLRQIVGSLEASEDEVDEESERIALESRLEDLQKQLLPQIVENWAYEFQNQWTHTCQRALGRLGELAWKIDHLPLVVQVAEAAFKHDPYDDKHWQSYLRAKSGLGDIADGLRHFNQFRRKLQEDLDADFSEETLELASNLKLGRITKTDGSEELVSQRHSDFNSGLIGHLLDSEPELAMKVFGTKSTFFQESKFSDVSIPILENLIERSEVGSEGWQTCMRNLIAVKSSLNDSKSVRELAPVLLEHTDDPQIKPEVHSHLSFALLVGRQYDRALLEIQSCLDLLEGFGQTKEAKLFATNKASILWHMGHFSTAREIYEQSFAVAKANNDVVSLRQQAVNKGNIGLICIMIGNDAEAYIHLSESLQHFKQANLESSYPLVYAPVGYVRYSVKNDLSGIDMLISGLKLAYKRNHIRAQQISLDFAAAVLAIAGKYEYCLAVVDYVRNWRIETSHEFSVAETMFIQRALDRCEGYKASPEFNQELPPREFLTRTVRALREVCN